MNHPSSTDLPTTAPPLTLCIPQDSKRFYFPQVPDREQPKADAYTAVWPTGNSGNTASAYAEIAVAMLNKLSRNANASGAAWPHHQVVAITSPGSGDGKTDLLLELAPQLAQRMPAGLLVVDACSHKPDLTAQLKLPASTKARQSTLIYSTNHARLNVLPVPAVDRPQEIGLEWIEQWREDWLLTILDMPSLADNAAAMIPYCDAVYLVVRLGYTSRRAIADSARAIYRCGGTLLGCLAIR